MPVNFMFLFATIIQTTYKYIAIDYSVGPRIKYMYVDCLLAFTLYHIPNTLTYRILQTLYLMLGENVGPTINFGLNNKPGSYMK